METAHTRRERLEAIHELMDNLGISFCEAARLHGGATLDLGDDVTATVTEHGRTLWDDRPYIIVDVNLTKR